jgi:hypothetical protein
VTRFSKRETAPTVTVAIYQSDRQVLIENLDTSGAIDLLNQQFVGWALF